MTDHPQFEQAVSRFEQAWRKASTESPDLAAFLTGEFASAINGDFRSALLVELVSIDIENHWRAAATNKDCKPLMLEEYVARLKEFGTWRQIPLELIGEEYRARRLWGKRPEHAEYRVRFPQYSDSLSALLSTIDKELESETADDHARLHPTRAPTSRLPWQADPEAPLRFDDFVLKQFLGAGGSGKVYRALQKSTGKQVAVKYIRKDLIGHAAVASRFVAESRTVAGLRHPGIIGVHGLGRTPNAGYFIVMDFVDGLDLQKTSNRARPTPVQSARWIADAADAIEHLHSAGIVHCDLKPANILLDTSGRVVVTDFGLARSLHVAESSIATFEGTAAFMAPEQIAEYWGPIGPATDVYGLGATLYYLLVGEPPHTGPRVADILTRIVSSSPLVAPSELRTDVPQELSDICLRCLQGSHDDRYSSAAVLAAALRSWAEQHCR